MRIVLALVVLLAACHDDSRANDVARVRAHLERVERELRAEPMTPARAIVLDELHRYIEAEDYPTNHGGRLYTPIFVDEDGARCAMAALIEASGEHALVERVARDHNYAYIPELAADAELGRWLAAHDLTLAEAARIQPGYSNIGESRYVPTASIVGTITGGTEDGDSALLFGAGVRVGIRRITETTGACDRCFHKSVALVAEYTRSAVSSHGTTASTNQLGLALSYEPAHNMREFQWYLFAGGLVSIDESSAPGSGFGGQLGVGFSFRTTKKPLFGELVASTIEREQGRGINGGVQLGVVW